MTARSTRRRTAYSDALPAELPEPEVLLGCYGKWGAAVFTDRPELVVERVREVMPPEQAKLKGVQRSFVRHVGIVRWSERHQCLWFVQATHPALPWRVDPARLDDELRARVRTEEPPTQPMHGHTMSAPLRAASGVAARAKNARTSRSSARAKKASPVSAPARRRTAGRKP